MKTPQHFPPPLNIESPGISFHSVVAGGPVAEFSSDRAAYDKQTAKMIAACFAGRAADLNYLWAKIEIIKNRHGGMPPAKD